MASVADFSWLGTAFANHNKAIRVVK